MRRILSFIPFFSLLIVMVSCSTSYRTSGMQYKDYRITATQPQDSQLLLLIRPYREQVTARMSDVVGVADESLEKSEPESTLGNFMADAFLTMARQKFNTQVDLSIMNYGGIRLTQLPAGSVTRGKIFELMPFDNVLVLQRLKGSTLQQLLDIAAAYGGWPVAGASYQIRNKKAVNVMIGGKPLDPSSTYVLANSDFVSNGGDNADMLRDIPQQSIGYLMRDALVDYIQWLKSQGKNIGANVEKRVTYAE